VSDTPPSRDDASGKAQPNAGQLAPGTRVGGKYEIKGLLGEGANGSVYEGEHCEIGHRVAIKVVHRSLASRDDIIARFRREARICGTIRHRNVGQVYDVGELADGAPYMVMELHEGRSLASLLTQDGPMPIATVIDVGRQLLQGLAAVHESGAIHRDVKPDNVMIMREQGGNLLLKLVDFGIGKSVTSDIRLRNVTQEGMVVGSPDYMPPEQLRGEEVDHRVDLYATGVVLYELVTGRVPFHAESLTELFVAILRDPVKPASSIRTDCPEELSRVIERALSREARERYQSAQQMERALAAIKVPVTESGRPSAPELLLPPQRSRPTGEGYALETERVRTAELQIPVRRAGSLRVLGAMAAFVMLVSVAWIGWASRNRAQRSAAAGPAPSSEAKGGVAVAAPGTEPVPIALPAGATTGTAELAEPGAVLDPGLPRGEDVPEAQEPAKDEPQPVEASGKDRKARTRKPAQPDKGTPSTELAKPAEGSVPADGVGAAMPVTELVQEAAAAFVRGQLPRARALYREATVKAPANADAWRGLAMASSRMGQREEAARALQRYLALRPNAPDAEALRRKLEGP
jgi:serine/threonine-protein kinase